MAIKVKADVTAIIPVYNGKAYLREAVESVFNQTLLPKQLIVIDDGSTDGSLEIFNRIKSPIPLAIVSQQNAGQSSARNKGVNMVKTEYVAFLDQDDYWFPRHIEILIKPFAGNPSIGWTYGNFDLIEPSGKRIYQLFLNSASVTNPKINLFTCLSEDMFILPSASIIRKISFDSIGGFDERLSGYEDDDLFLRLFRYGWQNIYINESLSAWRHYSSSTCFSGRMVKSRRLYAEKLMQEYKDIPEMNYFFIRDCIAPRFYNIAKIEYNRGLANKNYQLCHESYLDMKKYSAFFDTSWRMKLKLLFWRYPQLKIIKSRIQKL
jgi:glycosyltransferase involved in cell wall biosynthesis